MLQVTQLSLLRIDRQRHQLRGEIGGDAADDDDVAIMDTLVLRYVLGRVSEAYDPAFLLYCNEHTFVIAENLMCYVGGLDPSEPRYLGNRFRKEGERNQVRGMGGRNNYCSHYILYAGWQSTYTCQTVRKKQFFAWGCR